MLKIFKVALFIFLFTSSVASSFAKEKFNNGIYYQYIPNTGKPVLILSHPFASDLTIWNEVMPLLKKDFSLLLYDLRGQGKSKVTEGPYLLKTFGDDVIDLLDSLKIKDAYFCGISISGFIAEWLALNHPDRITKIVISNAGYSTQDEASQKIFKTFQEELYNNKPDNFLNLLYNIYFTERFKKNHKKRYLEIKNIIKHTNSKGMANGLSATLETDFANKLSNISIPTLIIQGKDEPGFDPIEVGNFMNKNISNSQLKTLSGGHVNAIEYPKEYAKELIHFLK